MQHAAIPSPTFLEIYTSIYLTVSSVVYWLALLKYIVVSNNISGPDTEKAFSPILYFRAKRAITCDLVSALFLSEKKHDWNDL